jgi:hypothetical protein
VAHTRGFFTALLFAVLAAAPLHAEAGYRLLILDGTSVRWGEAGHGATITFAVALNSSASRGVENCRKTSGVRDLLTHSHFSESDFRDALEEALRLWSKTADVHFEPAAPGTQADLTVTAESDPDGIAFTDVAHSQGKIASAIICLNPRVLWSAENTPGVKGYRLAYVLAHEVGHAIGLDHPSPDGELMSFEYSRTRSGLQAGDIAGAVLLYGAARNSAAVASRH